MNARARTGAISDAHQSADMHGHCRASCSVQSFSWLMAAHSTSDMVEGLFMLAYKVSRKQWL